MFFKTLVFTFFGEKCNKILIDWMKLSLIFFNECLYVTDLTNTFSLGYSRSVDIDRLARAAASAIRARENRSKGKSEQGKITQQGKIQAREDPRKGKSEQGKIRARENQTARKKVFFYILD